MTTPNRRPNPANQAALSAALSGAVDLSALKARAEQAANPPSAPSAQPAPTSRSQFVIDVSEQSFQADVIERSMTVPVILDLWAEWCEPCKALSPLLERLADEGQGSWILAKIDVDANQRIAQALGVQGIPAIKAISQGQILSEFQGVQPEANLRQFLKAVVEAAGGQLPAGAEPEEDPRIVQAEDAIAAGDLNLAQELYETLLQEQPGHVLAADALRQVSLMKRLDQAGDTDPERVIAAADAEPSNVEKQCAAADLQLAAGQLDGAFGRLLTVVRSGSDEAKDKARTRLIELFAIVGDADPAVGKARRDLASALF